MGIDQSGGIVGHKFWLSPGDGGNTVSAPNITTILIPTKSIPFDQACIKKISIEARCKFKVVAGDEQIIPWGPSDKIILKLFSYCMVDGVDAVTKEALPSDGTSAITEFVSGSSVPENAICASQDISLIVGTKVPPLESVRGLAIYCEIIAGPLGTGGILDKGHDKTIEFSINVGVKANIL
jgi:hypothetical protein